MKILSLATVLFAMFLQSMVCKAQTMSPTDTNYVIELNKKAWSIRVDDLEKSRKYALEAIRIASKLNYKKGLSYSFNIYGNYYKAKGNYDSARIYYLKSLEIRKKIGDPINIARSLRNIMSLEELVDNNDTSILIALQAIEVLKPYLDNNTALEEKAWLQTHLATVYEKTGELNKAIKLIKEAEQIFAQLENDEGMASVNLNLANIYESQKQMNKALAEYNKAIIILTKLDHQQDLAKAYNNLGNIYYSLKNFTNALSNYRKAFKLRQEYGFSGDITGSFLNLAIIYETFGQSDSAVLYYNNALNLAKKSNNVQVQYESHWNLGTLLYNQKKYSEALHHLLIAQNYISDSDVSPENVSLFNDISKAYNSFNKPDSAFFYSKKYNNLNDSLSEILRKSIVFESNLKEAKQQIDHQDERTRLQRIIIVSMGVSLILILIIFFLYYRFVRSKRNMLELRELVKDKELKALDAMLEGQHEERKRLAAELHDTIGSMLAATKLSFKAMEKSLEKMVEENRGQYGKINTMLDETMESVRRISHNMASGIFSEKGLEGALSDLCQTFEHPGRLHIQLSAYGIEQPMDYNIEVQLYRIVQELLTNIVKHAQATEVTIQLIRSSENVNLTVEDSGRGFNPDDVMRKNGIGLSNIDLRVKKLSGKWNIDSGKGRGTTVIIDIPVKNEQI